MRISRMGRLARPVIMVLLPPLMLLLLNIQLLAQEVTFRIDHAVWKLDGDTVIITYDLLGDADLTYEVNITLRRESDSSFKIFPISATGDLHQGKHAGKNRQIQWKYKNDVSESLPGDDYVFEFTVRIIPVERGSNLLYYLAGGAVVAGGAAFLLLSGSKSAETSTAGLPSPPTARPTTQ